MSNSSTTKINSQSLLDIALDPLNLLFLLIIIAVFFLGLLTTRFKSNAPSLMISIGITGTFLGIFLSLVGLDFSPKQMSDSVHALINGMQTAFFTSLAGMSGSIIFIITLIATKNNNLSKEETTAADINETLLAVKTGIQDLKGCLVGDEETSLSTQLGKMRNENRDGFNAMQKTFTEFADKVSELGTKAIIQALEGVIRDFNNKLTEQFGDNFKQLNQSVEKLVTWQEQYKEHVTTLTERFESAQDGIENTEKSIANIEDKASSITSHMEQLKPIITTVEAQINNLDSRLEAFSDMKDKATNALPIINENMEKLTSELKTRIIEASNDLKTAHKDAKSSIEEVSTGLQTIHNNTQNNIEELNKELQKEFKSNLESYAGTMERQANENTATVQNNIEQTLQSAQTALENTMNNSFEKFDQDMENEIGRTIQQMGNDLVSIMREFEKTHNNIKNLAQR